MDLDRSTTCSVNGMGRCGFAGLAIWCMVPRSWVRVLMHASSAHEGCAEPTCVGSPPTTPLAAGRPYATGATAARRGAQRERARKRAHLPLLAPPQWLDIDPADRRFSSGHSHRLR